MNSSIFIGNFFKMIDDTEVNILRKKIFAYTFGNVWIDLILIQNAGFFIFFKYRTIGINT